MSFYGAKLVTKNRIATTTLQNIRLFFGTRDIDTTWVPIAKQLRVDMVKEGAYINPNVSVDHIESFGIGLIAEKKLNKFDIIATVPRRMCLESDSIDNLVVETHKKLTTGKPMPFNLKYLRYMYTYGDIGNFPTLWPENAYESLVNAFYPLIDPQELLHTLRAKRGHLRQVASAAQLKLDKFLYTDAIVESRAYHLAEGGMEAAIMSALIQAPDSADAIARLSQDYQDTISMFAQRLRREDVSEAPSAEVLIPFVDFLNHSKGRDDCIMMFNVTKQEFHAVARAEIAEGEQVFVDYGDLDPLSMFMQYGIPPGRIGRPKAEEQDIRGRYSNEEIELEMQRQEREDAVGADAAQKAQREVVNVIEFISQYRRRVGDGTDNFVPM